LIVAGSRGDLARALSDAGLPARVIELPNPDRRRPLPYIAAVARLALELHRRREAVLLHVNDAPAYPVAGIAARLARLPRVCHLRFPYEADGLRWFLKHGFERAVFPSHFLADYARTSCPDVFPQDRCVVIHDGFEPPAPPGGERLVGLRSELGLAPTDRVIAFVGQVIEVKGVEDYLFMAASLLRRDPAYRFLIVGDDRQAGPSYRVRTEDRAAALGIAAACRFTGYRDDVWELLHLSDVVVVPSRVDPFPNVVLEAGAAARPVVATRVGGIPEMIRDGETGLLVPPRNPEALSEAVWGLRDTELGRGLGERAAAHVAACFGMRKQTRELADLYDEVLAERERRAEG
jgi:glycosyltransferase involved in cell wall biosynthesis